MLTVQVIEQFATARTEREVRFRCASCTFSGTATLTVISQGSAVEAATREDASTVAVRRAENIANRTAARSSLIIRCPECGSFDPESLKRYRRGRVALAMGLIVLGAILCVVGFALSEWLVEGIGVVFALCGLQPIWQAVRPPAVHVSWA